MKKFIAAAAAAMLLTGCTAIEEDSVSHETETLPPVAEGAADKNSDTDSRYIYYQLSEQEQIYYNELKTAVENFEEKVTYSGEIDIDTARKIYLAVHNQEPQLFWMDSIFHPPGKYAQILKYKYTKEQAAEKQKDIRLVTDKILSEVSDGSDYDKVVYFHDYLVRNNIFSLEDEHSANIYGALCGEYAQCQGYAFAFDYLCSLANIDCMTVTGDDGKGYTHAWNIVKLNGIWYNADCTWDDPVLEPPDPDFLRHYYFLVPDSDILDRSHFRNEEYFTYPKCYDSSRRYYEVEGMIADSASDGIDKLKKALEKAFSQGYYDAEVRFYDKGDYLAAQSLLFELGDIKRVINQAAEAAGIDGRISPENSLRYKNDELFIIHITAAPVS